MTVEKRNLLVVTNSFPDKDDKHIGGIFVKDQVRHIAPHFAQVHVVFPSTFGLGHRPREDFQDYSFDNVHVHFLRYANMPLFLRFLRGLFVRRMANAIRRLLEREGGKVDIIHAHFTWPSGAAAVRLKEKLGVPVVVTEHTSLTLNKAIEAKDPQFVRTWIASDAVVRNREGDMGLFESVGVPPEKLHYIPNGFDSRRFRLMDRGKSREPLGIPADKRVLVSIGGLEEVKGHSVLIEAVSRTMGSRTDILCYIIGEGPLRGALERQIAREGLEDRIKLVGRRPHGELPHWVCASDIVVHSSLSESGPMVMFEALGCGRPFIGTRVGAIPGVITSDDFGLISEPGDAESLRRNIESALAKDWDADVIVRHSKQYASELVSKELLDLYDGLLKGH